MVRLTLYIVLSFTAEFAHFLEELSIDQEVLFLLTRSFH